ncbi:TetR family transcriptional regulator, partial [Streptomyces cellulosae]
MVRRNETRRAALVDAAIEVLARDGARGLTFRAVDTEAAVPPGTASNYFSSRDDLLTQAGARVYERLQPDEETVARQRAAGKDRETYAVLMRELVGRIAAFRTGYLALLELRLEATRRPGLRTVLTERGPWSYAVTNPPSTRMGA